MGAKHKAFSVSISEMREDRFRGSGAGGQNRNKRDTGVRLVHEPSGAVAECEQERSQHQNRVGALRKIGRHPKFIAWARLEVAIRSGEAATVEDGEFRIELGASTCVPGEAHCDVRR